MDVCVLSPGLCRSSRGQPKQGQQPRSLQALETPDQQELGQQQHGLPRPCCMGSGLNVPPWCASWPTASVKHSLS